jgi:hypothetical protein
LENSDVLLYALVVVIFVVPCSQLYRWFRQCRLSNSQDIILAIIAIATISFQLNYLLHYLLQSKARSDLFTILTTQDVVALFGGNAFALSLSVQKITNLFPPSEKLDEQTEQLISRMLRNGISKAVIADVAQVSIQKIQAYVNSNSSESNIQIDADEIDSIETSPIIAEALPIVSEEKDKI